MIELYPRYAELLALRGSGASAGRRRGAPRGGSPSTTCATCRSGRSSPGSTRSISTATRGSGRWSRRDADFTEDDKAMLRTVELELLNAVIPAYRDAAARGQIEISTSPFYHPILPLLCDTDIYQRTHPDSRDAAPALPASRGRARAAGARGRVPRAAVRPPAVGLWPSEGSVSDAMVPLVAAGRVRVDGDRRADPGADARHRPSPGTRAGMSTSPSGCTRRIDRRAGGAEVALRVPRPRAVRPDRLHLRRLGRRRPRPTTSSRGSPRPAAGTRRGPAGKSRPSSSSSTARTPGSTSRAAAGRSCGRCTAGCRRIPSCGR